MAACHYCQNELQMEEYLETEDGFAAAMVCTNDLCHIHDIVNLYFKAWFMTTESIALKLDELGLEWSWNGKFFVRVTSHRHHEVRSQLEKICLVNGSILMESETDNVGINSMPA